MSDAHDWRNAFLHRDRCRVRRVRTADTAVQEGLNGLCLPARHADVEQSDGHDLHRGHGSHEYGVLMRVNRRASRGQVIVIFGVSAVAIFAVVSLAIDGGRVLMDQRSLQNLADGAALT
ncbi:MAG: hypothetical protein E6H98_00545, partial [Chloroflexi bacterium]